VDAFTRFGAPQRGQCCQCAVSNTRSRWYFDNIGNELQNYPSAFVFKQDPINKVFLKIVKQYSWRRMGFITMGT
jgi:hypothetical protein